MPLAAATRKNRRIDTFSIVPHAQPELLIVIADFNFNLAGRACRNAFRNASAAIL